MATETPREIAIRCLPNVQYEHLDGVLYQKWTSDCMPTETYQKLSQLKFTVEDVFSNGWPRSGNHWAYYVVDMILKQSSTPTTISFPESVPDVMTNKQLEEFKNKPSPRLFVSHARLKRYPDIARKRCKIVYVIRNPKDAMASYYKLLYGFAKEHRFTGTWDEFFEACFAGEIVLGSWFDHILQFEKFMADNPDVPVYIHQFEKMRQKPVETVKKLCAFLGKSDHLAEDIVAASSIENIKAVISHQTQNNTKFYGKEVKPKFLRKGAIGDWKNTFTVAQNERFDRYFEEKMAGSKLAQLVRPYI